MEDALNGLKNLPVGESVQDSQRIDPEGPKGAERRVMREFLDELPDWEGGLR